MVCAQALTVSWQCSRSVRAGPCKSTSRASPRIRSQYRKTQAPPEAEAGSSGLQRQRSGPELLMLWRSWHRAKLQVYDTAARTPQVQHWEAIPAPPHRGVCAFYNTAHG